MRWGLCRGRCVFNVRDQDHGTARGQDRSLFPRSTDVANQGTTVGYTSTIPLTH